MCSTERINGERKSILSFHYLTVAVSFVSQ
jgi:hypothetical protein